MQVTRILQIKLSALFILIGLVLIPCTLKQQLKAGEISITSLSTTKSNAKNCVLVIQQDQVNQKKTVLQQYNFNESSIINSIKSTSNFEPFFSSNTFNFFFKEKIPSYLLHCLFRI